MQYDVDGVFFNMFGYRNSNYSGEYYGICDCDNCLRRFRDMYGKSLPAKEDFSDFLLRRLYRVQGPHLARSSVPGCYRHIKQVNPKVAITGHRGDSDLIRLLVQRAVERPQPEWPYQAGEQAKWGRAYGQGKTVSSTSTNFVDYAWRFASETGAYHLLRFAQQLGSGATLDYYLLGVLDQDDKKAFAQVSKLFHWHAAHETDYAGLVSAAPIGLYHSRATTSIAPVPAPRPWAQPFPRRLCALVESRLPFDLACDELTAGPGRSPATTRSCCRTFPACPTPRPRRWTPGSKRAACCWPRARPASTTPPGLLRDPPPWPACRSPACRRCAAT